jgi:GNAT superfamily N-acetyltransferase
MLTKSLRFGTSLTNNRLQRAQVNEPPLRAELFGVEQLARHAEALGFHLVDMRLTLVRETEPFADRSLRTPTAQEIHQMALLARGSFTITRFYRDPRFAARASDFYETWVRNSCNGWAQWVRIAERDGRAAGFMTIRDNYMDLMAVATEGKGVATELVSGAINGAYELAISELRGRIQVDNIRVLCIHEKLGFLAEDLSLIYHKWYP